MRKLAKYIKPYILTVSICFIILFVEAMCELNLPNLMSNIVNVGIQNSGIENSAPEAISKNGFQLMTGFMNQSEKDLVNANYISVKTGGLSVDYDEYLSKYPILATEDIYVLKQNKSTSIKKLNSCFDNASMTMILALKQISDKNVTADEASKDISKINFDNLYKIIPVLESISDSQINDLRNDAKSIDDSIVTQSATMLTKQFYKEVGIDLFSIQSKYIFRIGLYMIIMTFLSAGAAITVSFFASRIAAGVAKTLRRDVFKKVESFSNSEFDKFSTASLITRTTNDVTQIQTVLVFAVRMVCYAPIMAIGATIMAAGKSTSMSWIIFLGAIVLICLISVIYAIAMPKFKLVQKLVDKINLIIRENLSGMMVIRAFGTQKFEENRFEKANDDLTKVNLFVNRVTVFMMPAMMFIMNSINLLVVWNGAHQIAESNMQVGDMMAFMQYAIQVIMSFLMISIMFILIPRASVSAERVDEVLETEPIIKDKSNPIKLDDEHSGTIEFKNVSFKYSDDAEYVLKDINFISKPGETTAFIGSTGSGKSTLVNLIPRFYDVTDGEILIDGVDIRDISQHDLRENIGYVPQKGILFSGDIKSNLRYGDKDATDEDIRKAADIAQATDFIESTEGGFDNSISQGGTNVSGGQKQRLSIARALVKKAKVYIFDDSFSALDFKTDAMLRKALKEYTTNSTVLIVAQRVSTIMGADQIIVLDKGHMVGKGTHEALLKTCETYKEIATSQLSKEELS